MGGQSEIHSLQGMKEKGNGPQIHQWLSPFSLPREDWAWKYYQNGEFFTQSKEDSRGQWSFLSHPAPSKLELWVWAFGLQNKDSAQRCWVRPTKKGEPHVLRENSTERPFLDSCPVVFPQLLETDDNKQRESDRRVGNLMYRDRHIAQNHWTSEEKQHPERCIHYQP